MAALSVREICNDDIKFLVNYWTTLSHDALKAMGADPLKLPAKEDFTHMLSAQIEKDYSQKAAYCIIWLENAVPVGHSNVNKNSFENEAYMHLHLWSPESRKKGQGVEFVKMSLPFFFKNLRLKKLFSEPYKYNEAPNKTLKKAGFQFVRSYTCVPGTINFVQEVNLWEMKRDAMSSL